MIEGTLRKAPFVRVLIPTAGGIVLARQLTLPAVISWITAGMIVLAILILVLVSDRSPVPGTGLVGPGNALLAGLFQGLFVCLGSLMGREGVLEPVAETMIQGRICDEVMAGGRSYHTRLDRVLYLSGRHWVTLEGSVQVYFQREGRCPDLRPGDCIRAFGELSAYEDPANPFEFDYGAYQRGNGVYYHLYLDSISWAPAGTHTSRGLVIRAKWLRRVLVERITRNIDGPDERAILFALLLGYRAGMPEDVRTHFVRSGSMHILAVSGLHVGILYIIPAFLISRIRRNVAGRLMATLVLMALLWCYALLTGLSPSVVRAVTMCSIHRTSRLMGRKAGIFHVLSLTAFIMVWARPAIIFMTGFQLSFAAVAGIAGFHKPLSMLIPVKGWLARRTWQLATVSLAAQLATAPLSIYYFHQFSPVSVISSMAVVPLAAVILFVGLAFIILSTMGLYPLSGLLEWLTAGLAWVTRLAGRIPGGFVEDLNLLPVQVLLLYLTLFLACLFLRRRRVWLLQGLMVTTACLLLVSCIREYRASSQGGFYVFAIPRETAISFVRGREHFMYRTGRVRGDSLQVPSALRNFCARHKLSPPVFLPPRGQNGRPGIRYHYLNHKGVELLLITFRECRILILRRWPETSPVPPPGWQTDILVLVDQVYCNPDSLINVFRPGQVIVDGSSYPGVHAAMAQACEEHGIPLHSTEKDGFYAN
jgi:competence protein ComEC